MKSIDDVCIITQARLGSQRVPNKMLRDFAGTTLMDIYLKKISNSSLFPIENKIVSVWEPELKKVSQKYNVTTFNRSKESALSEGTPMTQMYEWWDKLPYKYCVLVNACCPFLKLSTIEKFVEYYLTTSSDGLFGVMEKKNYFWNKSNELITPWPTSQAVMNTKFVEQTKEAAHCLYAGRLDKIGSGIWMGDFSKKHDIELFSVPEQECLDIDYEWQFKMCEILYKGGMR